MTEAVEQSKRQVAEEYRKELEKRKSQLGDEVEELKAKKRGVEAEIKEVRKRLAEEEALKQKTAESVAEAMFARARKAQNEVQDILAESAVLRPFLNNSAVAPSVPTARALAVETHRQEAAPLATSDAAYSHLKSQLENVGLQPRSASAVGREVLTALSLGQAVFLQGSMAPVLARTVASSLSGRAGPSWTCRPI